MIDRPRPAGEFARAAHCLPARRGRFATGAFAAGLAALVLAPAQQAHAVVLKPGGILVAERAAGGTSSDVGMVVLVDPVTYTQTQVASRGSLQAPNDVALDHDGDILVADGTTFTHREADVIRVDPDTGAQTVVSANGSLRAPTGIAVEADGDIVVADGAAFGGSGGVIRIDPDTGAQTTVSSGPFNQPTGLALEADGDILVADKDAIRRVNPVTGAQTTVSGEGLLTYPWAVTVEPDGDILAGDLWDGVVRVNPVTGAQTRVGGPRTYGLAVEPSGHILTTVQFSVGGAVYRIDPVTGASTGLHPRFPGPITRPTGVEVVPTFPDRPPVAREDSHSTNEDTRLNVAAPGLLANDSDRDADALSAAVVAGPAHGTLTLSANGSFAYTPDADYHGPDSFTYTANGAGKASQPATVSLTVKPVNDAPAAAIALDPRDPNGSGWYNGPVAVTASGTDPDGDAEVAQTRCVLDPASVPASYDELPAGPCALAPVSGDGEHTVYAASIDTRGTKSTPAKRSFKLDATAPAIGYSGNEGSYGKDDIVEIECRAADALSGLEGTTCAPLRVPARELEVGTHRLTATATDRAGNVATATAALEVRPGKGASVALDVAVAPIETAPTAPAGTAAPAAPAADPKTLMTWDRLRNGRTRIKTLAVDELASGETVELACHGKGCRKSADRTLRAKSRRMSLTRYVKGMTLRPGDRLTITVTRPGHESRVVKYTMARRSDPVTTTG